MGIRTVQSAFQSSPSATVSLFAELPAPSTVGDSLLVVVGYDSTGGPITIADPFGNTFAQIGAFGSVTAFRACLNRGGAGHQVTATSAPGKAQIQWLLVMQESLFAYNLGHHPQPIDYLRGLFENQEIATAELFRIGTALRANP